MQQASWVGRSSSWPPFSAGTCPSSMFSTRKLMSLGLAALHRSLGVTTEQEMGWGCVKGVPRTSCCSRSSDGKIPFGKQVLQDEGGLTLCIP